VYDAYVELESLEFEAIPYLFQYIDDDRFCRTCCLSGYFNMTVGETCRELITKQVDFLTIYGPSSKSDACDYFELKWENDVTKWWAQYWDKSLARMQIDCLKFKIKMAKELNLDYSEAEKFLLEIHQSNTPFRSNDGEPVYFKDANTTFRLIDDVLYWEHMRHRRDRR